MADQYVPPTNTAITAVVKGEFIGPVQTVFTPQPEFIAFCTNWDAFDVPRLWDSLRNENEDKDAWTQARGWENLGQLLADQHDRLLRLREGLASGWDPQKSPAARVFFGVLDGLLASMREDAYAHASTARGVDGILSTLKTAKEKLAPLKEEWDSVTTDWLPEWWDHAADDLNREGRAALAEADKAVKDYRRRIVIPAEYDYRAFSSTFEGGPTTPPGPGPSVPPGGSLKPPRPGSAGGAPLPPSPPPVPGYNPVLDDGPVLEGMPQPVPAVPGSPISMLPVPPGSPYAPHGGAYVLPGPGVGRGGWIQPMPVSPAQAPANARAAVGRAGTPGSMGAMPLAAPMGGPAGRNRPGGQGGQRPGDVVWEVARGVPPVIGEATDPPASPTDESAADTAFIDWFADVATPWTDDLKVSINRGTDQPS